MFRTRYSAVCAVLIAAAGIVMTVAPTFAAEAGDQQAQYLAVLRSDAPAAEKALACKGLAIYGGKDAVPALAPALLTISTLSEASGRSNVAVAEAGHPWVKIVWVRLSAT